MGGLAKHHRRAKCRPMIVRTRRFALYAALMLPLTFGGLPIYLHAPDLYATEYGVSLAALSGVLLLLRGIDAVQDPLIGMLCDRLHAYRAAVTATGLAMMALGFWALFNPGESALLWFALSVLLCTTGFSVASISYQTSGGLWNVAPETRATVTGWREAFGLVGLLLASVLPVALASQMPKTEAFSTLALIFIPLLALGGLLFTLWLRSASLRSPAAGHGQLPPVREFLSDPPLARFLGIFFFSSLASAIPGVLFIFYVRDRLGAEEMMQGVFLLLYFVSGAASMALWQWAARRIGKARAWLASMVLAVVTFVWAFTLGAGDEMAFAVVCLASGAAFGADLALPPAILADRIEARKDEASAARYFAATNFLAKSALALASGLTLGALALAGYEPGVETPGDPSTDALAAAYALIPCVLKVGVALWLWRSDVGDAAQDASPSEPVAKASKGGW